MNFVDTPPHRLVIAAQHYEADETRMMRVVRLLCDIEPRKRDDVVIALVRRFDCPQSKLAVETMLYANEKFTTCLLQSTREGVGHPDGANALMAGTMDLLSDPDRRAALRASSVFLVEADGVPLRADWLDVLIAAHRSTLAAGKRVTGPEMNQKPHVNGGLIAHLSLWRDRPSLHETPEGQAWDLFHADVFLAEARTTRAILNVYGENRWSPESLTNLSRDTAWLCSQKDDSALDWAERTLTAVKPVTSSFSTSIEAPKQEQSQPKTAQVRHFVCAPRSYQLPVLFQSMVRHCQPFVLHVLAWDFDPPASFADPNVRVYCTSRTLFLHRHPELATLPGPPRNTNETVCSVRWRFALDVMEQTGQPVTLIDGDQFFFSSPEPVFEEIGDVSYALSPHAFAPAADGVPGVTQESHGRFGKFNGGWSYWAIPDPLKGMAILSRSWCYQGFHDVGGRQLFGDQGWLEVIAENFPGGHDIRHPGVNTGPWNVNRWKVEDRDGAIYLDGRPLISFHSQSLKPGGQLFDPSYAVTPDREAIIYPPYLAALGVVIP